MQKFEWTDRLSIGVPLIDTQHKELIAAFNDLSTAIEQGNAVPAVKKLLVFLKYYAEWHFEKEEACAAQHLCPIAETNQAAHARFMQIFSDLQTEYRQSGASEAVARKAHAQLADWLVNHILKIDTQIGHCIQQAQAQ